MFKRSVMFKYTPILMASILAACGGGGGAGGSSTSVTNDLNPSGSIDLEAGGNAMISSRATVLRSSITKHAWFISQVSGETALPADAPTIGDANCATAAKKLGAPATAVVAGVNGSSTCQTSLAVPDTAKPGEWEITNVATSTDGSSGTGRFRLSVKLKAPSTTGFAINVPKTPQIQELNKLAQLSATYVVNTGVKVDFIQYSWTQVSGTPVNLAGADTAAASFIAATSGEYVFRVKAIATINGKQEIQEGNIVVSVASAVAVTYFDVDAGNVQVGTLKVPVQLVGKVVGNAMAGTLDYTWSQVSGPQQVVFANANTLNASFIPVVGGTYVFQLKVNSSAGFKTATTTVAVESLAPTSFAVQAGDVQVGKLSVPTFLTGKVTGTADTTKFDYEWSQVSGPQPVTFANEKTLNASFIPTTSGTYVFQLKAGSVDGFKTSNTTVAIEPAQSTVPFFVVSSGDTQRVLPNSVVALKATVAVGTPPPTNIAYQWTQVSGPTVVLSNANNLQASFIAASQGTYTFKISATANGVTSASETTVVAEDVQSAPFFIVSAGDAQLVDVNTVVMLKGQIAAGTPPPSNITYQWKQTSGAAVVLSNPTSLQASFIPVAVGTYGFEVTATASGISKTSNTTVSAK